jgi:hypothetical protein
MGGVNMDILMLKEEDFVGKGNERVCYVHPEDRIKAVKCSYEQDNGRSKQTTLEVATYKMLLKKDHNDWKHLPEYFGTVETNKGEAFVVELIRDFDGEVSKSFEYYINKYGVDTYANELVRYKEFFLKYSIIFNYGMMPKNILLRKNSETDFDLVLIDGLGDVSHFTFIDRIKYFASKKINRRWDKFIIKYLSK